MDGDLSADLSVHGDPQRAVLFYALSNYEFWAQKLGVGFADAVERGFGENITLEGVDESGICVGDILQIGEVVLEVNQPRSPCWKIGAYWNVPTLTKDVYRTGRSGWFARVLRGGSLRASQSVELISRPNPELTIAALNQAIVEVELHAGAPGAYAALCACAAACEALAPSWRNAFAQAHERTA
jgi:MOSC domain-containing protein YiiM